MHYAIIRSLVHVAAACSAAQSVTCTERNPVRVPIIIYGRIACASHDAIQCNNSNNNNNNPSRPISSKIITCFTVERLMPSHSSIGHIVPPLSLYGARKRMKTCVAPHAKKRIFQSARAHPMEAKSSSSIPKAWARLPSTHHGRRLHSVYHELC